MYVILGLVMLLRGIPTRS